MPFYYDVKVPTLGSTVQTEKYMFSRWLLAQRSYIKAGTALAIIQTGEVCHLLRNAGEGFFTPWKIRAGDEIASGPAIGRITTDGDLIPYGRPYVTFETVPSDQP